MNVPYEILDFYGVKINIVVLCVMAPCCIPICGYRRFGGIYYHMSVTKTRVWIGNWIYWILKQVVTTINYNTVTDLHNL
jgi:hypothetical protein